MVGFGASHEGYVFLVANEAPSHALEVRSGFLAVDERAAMLLHVSRQGNEGELAGAGFEREHALSHKSIATGHAIEPAGKRVATPHLHAASTSQLMQAGVGLDDIVAQPCPIVVDAPIYVLNVTRYWCLFIKVRMEWLTCISSGKITNRCRGQYQCISHLRKGYQGKYPLS